MCRITADVPVSDIIIGLTVMNAFDRQTDRQMDTFLIASPHWHSMQCEKNATTTTTFIYHVKQKNCTVLFLQ